MCGIAIFLLSRAGIPLPENAVILAAVRGETPLPETLPEVWKRAVEHTSFPSLLGLARDGNRLVPFALTIGSVGSPSLHEERAGIFSLVSEDALSHSTSHPLSGVLFLLARTFTSRAFLTLDLRVIDERLAFSIAGPIDRDGAWNTGVKLPHRDVRELPSGDNAIDLEAFPDAWPIIQRVSRGANFALDIADRPNAIGWTSTSDSIPLVHLRFDAQPSSSTVRMLASSAGLVDRVAVKLPDDVVSEEFRLPSLASASTSIEIASGTELQIGKTSIDLIRSGEGAITAGRACRSGRPVARFTDISIPSFPVPVLHLLEFAERDGKLIVCVD